jgi:lysozyme
MQDIEITESQAEELLIAELKRCASAVNRLCPALLPEAVVNNNWGRFNAAVDFVYNLGAGRLQTSTLRRKINARVWYGAKVELMKWVRGGGRVLPGLVLRRKAECELI